MHTHAARGVHAARARCPSRHHHAYTWKDTFSAAARAMVSEFIIYITSLRRKTGEYYSLRHVLKATTNQDQIKTSPKFPKKTFLDLI